MFGKLLLNFSLKLWFEHFCLKILLNLLNIIILQCIFNLNRVNCDFWNFKQDKLINFIDENLHQSASRVLDTLVIVLAIYHNVIWQLAPSCKL